MNILFVCTGNVSRSYLAEMLFKNEVSLNQLHGIHAASAGILDYAGIPADPVMVKYLTKMHVPAGEHLSRTISQEDIEWADKIFVMENRHREFIKERWPNAVGKMERLGGHISPDQPEDDIIDPYGKSPQHYRVVQSQISQAVGSIFRKLFQDRSSQNTTPCPRQRGT
jgi:protein arginine phosphatase